MLKTSAVTIFAVAAVISIPALQQARAGDTLRINIPRRSQMTPVQRLNREGVEAIKKNAYEKAEALFYKAYLYDPSDPFTLNNLGYVSELEGQLERAQKFYHLAAEQGCDADIDLSSAKHLEGKPMKTALIDLQDAPMRVNRMNVNAIQLLSEDRGFEAVALLKDTLKLDPRNPFTLNNLGVAYEAIGNYDEALKSYHQAAQIGSSEPVVVTLDHSWRGRPVSRLAEESEAQLRKRLQNSEGAETRAALLALRGVYAINQNDWGEARQDFLKAYTLDPWSAFSLNNLGYVAEKDGDLETAQFFYGKALKAGNSSTRVGLATDLSAQGKRLSLVTRDSDAKVDNALDAYSRQRRRETGPVELTPRGDTPSGAPPQAPQ